MPDYRRAHHRSIVRLLAALDGEFLLHCGCYFGGGTRLALLLHEYRESRDIDFLCSSRPGFRELRSAVDGRSLGPIVREPLPVLDAFQQDRSWAKRSIASLGITDTHTLRAGLRRLRRLQQSIA